MRLPPVTDRDECGAPARYDDDYVVNLLVEHFANVPPDLEEAEDWSPLEWDGHLRDAGCYEAEVSQSAAWRVLCLLLKAQVAGRCA